MRLRLLPPSLLVLAVAAATSRAAGPEPAYAAPFTSGAAVYQKWCAPCHDPGIEHPGTHALMSKYPDYKTGVLKQWPDLDPARVKLVVRHGISIMPPFRKTEITDQELELLAQWLTAQGKGP